MVTDPIPDNLRPTIRVVRKGHPFQVGRAKHVGVYHIVLPISGLSADLEGLKVLHLGDTHLHADDWEPAFDRLLETTSELKPDVICHTGDWIDDKFDYRPAMPLLKRLVDGLLPHARLGLWTCIGNHDGDLLAPRLIDLGVRVLLGETARFATRDGALELVGLPGVARDDLTPKVIESIVKKDAGTTRIMLCHFPDAIRKTQSLNTDLQLSGHTHAGQVSLPGGRPIITHDRLPKEISGGLHRVNGTWLHITKGIGWTGLPLRIFAPAEVTVIELRRAQ
jgi:uncharacterized protein